MRWRGLAPQSCPAGNPLGCCQHAHLQAGKEGEGAPAVCARCPQGLQPHSARACSPRLTLPLAATPGWPRCAASFHTHRRSSPRQCRHLAARPPSAHPGARGLSRHRRLARAAAAAGLRLLHAEPAWPPQQLCRWGLQRQRCRRRRRPALGAGQLPPAEGAARLAGAAAAVLQRAAPCPPSAQTRRAGAAARCAGAALAALPPHPHLQRRAQPQAHPSPAAQTGDQSWVQA